MFLFFLSSANCGRSPTCEAPLTFAEPINNAKLLQIQLLLRHGERTPGGNHFPGFDTGEWHCDENSSIAPRYHPAPAWHPRDYYEHFDSRLMAYPPSCRPEDLTTYGMQQHFELGKAVKEHYSKNEGFMPENANPETTYARATELDRTVKSAVSFLQGMYPPTSPNEVVPLITDTPEAGILHPDDEWCKELQGMEEEFFAQQFVQDYYKNFSAKYKKLFVDHRMKFNLKQVKKYSSFISLASCSEHNLPDWITDELIDDCKKYLSFYNYNKNNMDKYRGVGAAPLFREMFRIADQRVSLQNKYKIVLLSSHDGALLAVLSTFKFTELYGPTVRSHLILELWDRNGQIWARFVFNGKPLVIDFVKQEADTGLFLYSNFKIQMARLGYINHCYVPEWEK
ncbi:Histidine acid phosphatase family protein [Trichomonas vaginalis G3]|uniref:Histidine acid phosphatase family protein n=1 Tax=Trichomonas vaginalis (strain ATCC PRA-98 / G3) TaxID=412133 RepID=A2GB89_TRIV3|nr:histidine acid phosphatase [Trichomonas vaginalis G3]EAX85579.1 Histidine acid phosphatase family protein [Trichomonas vaginalis G3]KAI5538720.1 acid phosphatase protein [Trichomonas vaginalis G3]|eukprot:XP_001298509.1 histidine acid phosphatase [Trichomonas vaginalis G3]